MYTVRMDDTELDADYAEMTALEYIAHAGGYWVAHLSRTSLDDYDAYYPSRVRALFDEYLGSCYEPKLDSTPPAW